MEWSILTNINETYTKIYNYIADGPRPGSAQYIRGQKKACEEVTRWHERYIHIHINDSNLYIYV